MNRCIEFYIPKTTNAGIIDSTVYSLCDPVLMIQEES